MRTMSAPYNEPQKGGPNERGVLERRDDRDGRSLEGARDPEMSGQSEGAHGKYESDMGSVHRAKRAGCERASQPSCDGLDENV